MAVPAPPDDLAAGWRSVQTLAKTWYAGDSAPRRPTKQTAAAAQPPAETAAQQHTSVFAAKLSLAPLVSLFQSYCDTTARAAVIDRKKGFSFWVRKALADGMGGEPRSSPNLRPRPSSALSR